jgi:hypothetical protein
MFSDRYRPVAVALTAFAAVACVCVLSSSTNPLRPTPKTEPYAAQQMELSQPRPRSAAGREVVLVRSLPPSPESHRYRISDVAP